MRSPSVMVLAMALAACSGSTIDIPGGTGHNDAGDDSGSGGSGGSGGSPSGGSGGATGGASGTGGTTSSGGTSGIGGSSGSIDAGLDGAAGTPIDATCASEVHPAEPVPRALLVLLDHSASMEDLAKWDGVRDGLTQFASAPSSAGLYLGVLPFPVPPTASIPTDCVSDPECGIYGPCLVPLNKCAGSFATNTSCDPADYADSGVAMAALPGSFAALESVISSLLPDGEATPTSPALAGAIVQGSAFHPAPDAIIDLVLLTDGEPTGCMTNDEASVATTIEGALPMRTFVIAIGLDGTVANTWAAAGDTGEASLINPGPDASQQVRMALDQALADPCALRLPPVSPFDPNLVNVTVQPLGEPDSILCCVGDPSNCDACDGLGWYFDDPVSPTRIELCPDACTMMRQPDVETYVSAGCLTVEG